MKKLSNTEAELKESVAYKKKECIRFAELINYLLNNHGASLES